MELRHLTYFRTVAEELHFRKAADRLFISQPPLSRQIKELEEELGVLLFERNNKNVRLTDAGLYLKKEADKIFSQLEACRSTVKQIHEAVSGQLRIGYISSSYHVHLADTLTQMRKVYPYVKTKLFEFTTLEQIQALEKDRIDIGIMRAPITSDKFKVISLRLDHFVVAMPGERCTFDTLEQLAAHLREQPFIFFSQEYAPEYFHKLEEICQRMGFYPDIVHEANNVHSILRLVASGLGVSILPMPLKDQYAYKNVVLYDLSMFPIHTELVLACKHIEASPAAQWFIERYKRSIVEDADTLIDRPLKVCCI